MTATIGESQVKTISRISLAAQALTVRKAVAIIVTSAELMRSGGPKVTRLFQQELARAVAAETDARFLAVISAGISGTPSPGTRFRQLVSRNV